MDVGEEFLLPRFGSYVGERGDILTGMLSVIQILIKFASNLLMIVSRDRGSGRLQKVPVVP